MRVCAHGVAPLPCACAVCVRARVAVRCVCGACACCGVRVTSPDACAVRSHVLMNMRAGSHRVVERKTNKRRGMLPNDDTLATTQWRTPARNLGGFEKIMAEIIVNVGSHSLPQNVVLFFEYTPARRS